MVKPCAQREKKATSLWWAGLPCFFIVARIDINQTLGRDFFCENVLKIRGGLSKGYHDVDVESIIRPGEFAGDQKPCIGTTEATFGNYFLPMIPKLKTEVQDNKHIIPEDSKQDWVRGGLPTRQMVRNQDYLRRCQQKTFK